MIKVEFKKPVPSVEFDDWLNRCSVALQKMKSAKNVSDKLYKEQRHVFLSVFNGKCAYCEAKVVLDQHYGDVEHYRPKGGVTDQDDKVIKVTDDQGHNKPHPGYYWLAYDLQNLLPSCIACNRPNNIDGRRVGKWNRFPVVGSHALKPEDIAKEEPLLLNPFSDDPADHLEFDPATGRLIGKTNRGQVTIELLNLNREGLPETRREVYYSVIARMKELYGANLDQDDNKIKLQLEFLQKHQHGQAAYAIAGRKALAKDEGLQQILSTNMG